MKIIECPRDAWQGMSDFIPTTVKAMYLNKLLKIGFDTIDFGSFVSHSAMPQVRDTAELAGQLDLSGTSTRLLAIVVNERGAKEASLFEQITCMGFPFSLSETFQLRNANATIAESYARVEDIQNTCLRHKKELVVYLSMGFGNPYGDDWSAEVVQGWIEKLSALGIRIFSLADTVGMSEPLGISELFSQVIPVFPHLEIGAHFHSYPGQGHVKIAAAHLAGCRRFDSAVLGYGGCPMAQDALVGNIPTEDLIAFGGRLDEPVPLDLEAFSDAKAFFSTAILGRKF
jgi:hydroxymethylglutaryl-CoA lyase